MQIRENWKFHSELKLQFEIYDYRKVSAIFSRDQTVVSDGVNRSTRRKPS